MYSNADYSSKFQKELSLANTMISVIGYPEKTTF
jgi:hypothetical protein